MIELDDLTYAQKKRDDEREEYLSNFMVAVYFVIGFSLGAMSGIMVYIAFNGG